MPSLPTKMPQVQRLDLSGNHISAFNNNELMPFAGGSLKWLDLSGNQIYQLPAEVFDSISELSSLNISCNPLRSIEPPLFRRFDQVSLRFKINTINLLNSSTKSE